MKILQLCMLIMLPCFSCIPTIYYDRFLDSNGDVQFKRCIMMDDVFIYHAHILFALYMVCVGANTTMSTSIEYELTKIEPSSNTFSMFFIKLMDQLLFLMVSLQIC